MTFAPEIRTQADLETAWRTLMGPFGYRRASVWLMFIGPDDRPIPQLTEIQDADTVPDAEQREGLGALVLQIVDGLVPGGRVAFLRSRPGRDGLGAEDRAWAASLYAACRDVGVATEVVHVANDEILAPVPLDDLPSARSA